MADPLGRTLVSGPLGPRVRYRLDAELPPLPAGGSGRTPYVRWGDWPGTACVTVTAVLLAFLTVGNKIDTYGGSRRKPPPRDDGFL